MNQFLKIFEAIDGLTPGQKPQEKINAELAEFYRELKRVNGEVVELKINVFRDEYLRHYKHIAVLTYRAERPLK